MWVQYYDFSGELTFRLKTDKLNGAKLGEHILFQNKVYMITVIDNFRNCIRAELTHEGWK